MTWGLSVSSPGKRFDLLGPISARICVVPEPFVELLDGPALRMAPDVVACVTGVLQGNVCEVHLMALLPPEEPTIAVLVPVQVPEVFG